VPNTVHIKAPASLVFDTHWNSLIVWLHPWSLLGHGILGPLESLVSGLPDWGQGLAAVLSAPGVLLAMVALWGSRRRPWAWVLAGACGAWLLYLSRVYPDWMPGSRFYQPIAPVFVLLITFGLGDLLTAAKRFSAGIVRYGLALGLAVVCIGLIALTIDDFNSHEWEIAPTANVIRGYRALGEYLRDHAWPGSTLELKDAGAMPYYSGLFTIDYAGLLDKHMALVPYRPATVDKGDGVIRHYKQMRYDPAYVLSRRPDFVYFAAQWLPDGRLKCRFPEEGQLYQAMRQEGAYDFMHPVYYQDGNLIIKRKDAGVMP